MLTEILVPIVAMATIFGIVYVVITARNRERISMIEKGVNPKDFLSAGPNVYGILKWALLLLGVGLGLFIGSLFDTCSPPNRAYQAANPACELDPAIFILPEIPGRL